MPRTLVDAGLLATVLAAVTALAELLGATNLGTALAFGTIAYVVALLAVLLRA